MAIYRNPGQIVRARMRQTKGLAASINNAAPVFVTLGQAKNEAMNRGDFAIERDRHDVFIKASDYGVDPKVGDTIVVTLPDGAIMRLGVYVPESSNQCFANSDFEGTELRVFCKEQS